MSAFYLLLLVTKISWSAGKCFVVKLGKLLNFFYDVHGMTPEYLRSRFVSRDDITSYRLRNTENKLALPQPRTNYLKKTFSYSGAKFWNSLSHDLRSAASLNDFKRKLRHHSFEGVQDAPHGIHEKQL